MSFMSKSRTDVEFKPTRRIITGHDAQGRSVFKADCAAPNIKLHDHGPLVAQVLWASDRIPASCSSDEDPAPVGADFRAGPARGGTILRIVDFPPDSAYELKRAADLVHELHADESNQPSARHFLFHKTKTLDYAIVLKGEIWALMDVGETLMQEGDVLIQRATHHSWSNRTERNCRMAFVLIDADGEEA